MKVPWNYKVSKFSQDLESLLAPIFSIRIKALSLVGVRHPALRSAIRVLDVFLFLVPPERPPGFRPRRFRSGLRRICFSVPTNKSSTLWFSIADTSMYFASNESADNRPSAKNKLKLWAKFGTKCTVMFSTRVVFLMASNYRKEKG